MEVGEDAFGSDGERKPLASPDAGRLPRRLRFGGGGLGRRLFGRAFGGSVCLGWFWICRDGFLFRCVLHLLLCCRRGNHFHYAHRLLSHLLGRQAALRLHGYRLRLGRCLRRRNGQRDRLRFHGLYTVLHFAERRCLLRLQRGHRVWLHRRLRRGLHSGLGLLGRIVRAGERHNRIRWGRKWQ